MFAGNCNSSAAVLAGLSAGGLDQHDIDIFWADAHADVYVPDDPSIGYFDSKGTLMLTGLCWTGHMNDIEGHYPFLFSRLNFLGIRSYESEELVRLHGNNASILFCESGDMYMVVLEQYLLPKPQNRRAFVHVDPDVLDTSVRRANDYACLDGLLANDFIDMLDLLTKRNPTPLTLASLDPDLERGGKIVQFTVQEICTFAESAGIISSIRALDYSFTQGEDRKLLSNDDT